MTFTVQTDGFNMLKHDLNSVINSFKLKMKNKFISEIKEYIQESISHINNDFDDKIDEDFGSIDDLFKGEGSYFLTDESLFAFIIRDILEKNKFPFTKKSFGEDIYYYMGEHLLEMLNNLDNEPELRNIFSNILKKIEKDIEE